MTYDFDHLPGRRGTDSVKWGKYGEDTLPMWVADMDFPVAEPVRKALLGRVEHGIFGYPDTHCEQEPFGELRQILVERMKRLYRWEVSPEEILFLPGVIVGLNLTCQALLAAGDEVMIQTPVYPPFLGIAKNAGLNRRDVPLLREPDGHYEIDWEAFERVSSTQTRLFILCNPHNPVGRVFRKAELERLAEICLRKGIYICSDEIHCDLVYQGYQHIPIASLDQEISRHTVTLMSPTKTFNIAGLQCSFAIVQDADLRQRLEQAKRGLVMWVNLMGATAALVAYRDSQEWLDQVLAYLEGNRNMVFDFIRSEVPAIKLAKPEGTYLAWLDCRETPIAENPYEYFLERAGVAFNDGSSFGCEGNGFVRLNFGCARETLRMALQRIRASLHI